MVLKCNGTASQGWGKLFYEDLSSIIGANIVVCSQPYHAFNAIILAYKIIIIVR